jgi:hypothetical protein
MLAIQSSCRNGIQFVMACWINAKCILHMEKDQRFLNFPFCDLVYRFDSLRVTPRLLDVLATGPEISGDLAVELALAGPQFTQVITSSRM